jgi:allantoinase
LSNPRIPFQFSPDRPTLVAPSGRPLIIQTVVNVEFWPFDQPMPRTILPSPHGVTHTPDVPNFSWVEYGMRCGLPRLLNLLSERHVPTVASMNAAVIDAYPRAAEAIRNAEWEFMGHGVRQQTLHKATDEREVIAEALTRIQDFTGTRPRGWLGPGLQETDRTPEILKQEKVDFVCDWVLDDLPTWLETALGSLVAVPYALDLNDSVVYAVERHATGELFNRVNATVTRFEQEISTGPRVLTLALHPHLMGVPHRIDELARGLDLLLKHPQVSFMTGSQICDWFLEANTRVT